MALAPRLIQKIKLELLLVSRIYFPFSQLHRSFVENSEQRQQATSKNRGFLYKKVGVFGSNVELAKRLEENILFYEPKQLKYLGLLVVNKPFGVPKHACEDSNVCLANALPLLAESLKVPQVNILKSVSRFSSGPILLHTKADKEKERLERWRKRSLIQPVFCEKYLAITHGVPRMENNLEVVYARLEESGYQKKNLLGRSSIEPVISREFVTNSQIRKCRFNPSRKEIKHFCVSCKVLAKSESDIAALVSVEPSNTSWNFIQVYLADLLSPVVGDYTYSYRVKQMLGKRVRISHTASPSGNQIDMNVPDWVLHRLGVEKKDQSFLPLHIHLFRTCLPDFYGKGKHLMVHAPIPKHFRETLASLSFNTDFDELEKTDCLTERPRFDSNKPE